MNTLDQNDQSRAFTALLKLLTVQLDVQKKLCGALDEKREAIRTADVQALEASTLLEGALLRRLKDLEGKRRTLVGGMSQSIAPGGEALSLHDLVAHAESTTRERLTEVADDMRTTAAAVRHQSAVLRQASESLSRHLSGILQTMRSALSRAGVYGNRGAVAYSAPLDASLDLQS
jgi:hypothetical protein